MVKRLKLFALSAVIIFAAPAFITLPQGVYAAASPTPTAVSVTYYDGVYTRGFTWKTSQSVPSGEVQITEKTDGMTKNNIDWSTALRVTAASENLPATAIGDTANNKVWKAHYNFGASAEGKTFFFRVGTSSVANGWSTVGEQRIDGGNDGVYLLHTTDPQSTAPETGYNTWKKTVEKAYETHPKAQTMITTGDFTEDGENASQWNYMFNMPLTSANTPLFMDTVLTPVSGNHDGFHPSAEGMFAAHFNVLSVGQSQRGFFYSYNIGNVHITVLNTDSDSGEVISPVQMAWIKADLAEANANPGIEWKIVAQHFPMVSTAGSVRSSFLATIRNQLFPVMSEYKVDLVLQGHDHSYARSNPLALGSGNYDWEPDGREPVTGYETVTDNLFGTDREYMIAPGGTTYIVINTAGDRGYDPSEIPQNQLPAFLRDGTGVLATNPVNGQVASGQPNKAMFGAISVEKSALLYESYTVDRTTGETALFDYFGVIKDVDNIPNTAIAITEQPQDVVVDQDAAATLSVQAAPKNDGALTYQWYANTVKSNKNGDAIPGANGKEFSPDTSVAGAPYYYAVVTNRFIYNGAERNVPLASNAVAVVKKIAPKALTVDLIAGGRLPRTEVENGAGFTASLALEGKPQVLVNTKLTANITLTAKEGFTFSGYENTAAIAGFTVNGVAPEFIENTGDRLKIKVSLTIAETKKPDKGGCNSATAASGILVVLGIGLFKKKF